MALIVEPLDKVRHNRSAFDCGETVLNEFLQTKAAKHQTQRVSRTFVLSDDAEPAYILDYYSLATAILSAKQFRQIAPTERRFAHKQEIRMESIHAPDLLDALRSSQQAIREMREQGAPTALWDDIEAANLAAIARATGDHMTAETVLTALKAL